MYKLFKYLERRRLARSKNSWRPLLEERSRMLGLFSKAQLCVFGCLMKEHCLATLSMVRFIRSLYKRTSALFVAQYLKASAVHVMWYVGGDRTQKPSTTVFVSLTRSGIPTFIPPIYRKRLRQDRNSLIARYILTVCNLSRVIYVWLKGAQGAQRVPHASIHQPGYTPTDTIIQYCSDIMCCIPDMLKAYTRNMYSKIPFNLGWDWKPLWTSGPNTYVKPGLDTDWFPSPDSALGLSTFHIGYTLPIDATALITLWKADFIGRIGAILFERRDHYVVDGWECPVTPLKKGDEAFSALLERLSLSAERVWWKRMRTRPENGRLSVKLEGAGKRRVFAICNPVLQTLLRPLHNYVMAILKGLSTDGTFNQTAPLNRLKGKLSFFSFDLKAATDTFPACVSACLLKGILGDEFGQTWLDIMQNVAFRALNKPSNIRRRRAPVYRFTCGQPLGFYSSWPVFALTHHACVWLAAWKVRPGERFMEYAILGDDLVIACPKVAKEYQKLMTDLGVIISAEKSLISVTGACEFAKKFMVQGVSKSLSPVSSALLMTFGAYVPAIHYYEMDVDYKTSVRLRGGGYRAYNTAKPKSKAWRRHYLSLLLLRLRALKASGMIHEVFTMWVTSLNNKPVDCYRYGATRAWLARKLRPKSFDELEFLKLKLAYPGDEVMVECLIKDWVAEGVKAFADYLWLSHDLNVDIDSSKKTNAQRLSLTRAHPLLFRS